MAFRLSDPTIWLGGESDDNLYRPANPPMAYSVNDITDGAVMILDGMKCDVCGDPATHAARDAKEIEPSQNYRRWEPIGYVKFGCATHKQESKRIYREDQSDA